MGRRLIIDVSHIMAWQGRLTGIERVEHHLIGYYFNQEAARFVVWDSVVNNFFVLDNKDVEDLVLLRPNQNDLQVGTQGSIKKVYVRADRLLKKIKAAEPAKKAYVPDTGESFLVLAGLWDKPDYIDGLKKMADSGTRLIHVVYDMIPILHPSYVVEFLPPIFANYMKEILPECKAILAISESSARDTRKVLESYGLPVPLIKSFRLGDDIAANEATERVALDSDFMLIVGTIEARKNHELLYYMYGLASEQGIELPPTVVAGRRGWMTSDFQYLVEKDPEIAKKIIILDKVNDAQLQWLYQNCTISLCTSFYEGWGLPVAEALYHGKVTLSSGTSSLSEIAGPLVDYFSPYSAAELLELVSKYLDKKVREEREAKIKSSYKPYQWESAAKAFAALVNELAA